jgi:peptide/nickel transport system substrate-binding protein
VSETFNPTVELDRRSLLKSSLAAGVGLSILGGIAAPQIVGAQEDGTGGTLIFNGLTNPSGFDPHITGAVVSWYVLDNLFDRLVRIDPATLEPVPSLAESYEVSPDGLTYTFTLRDGVTFHNGRALTSADVKYSFERIINPDVPAVAKGYFSALSSIEAPDDKTVKLIYSQPFAPLLLALTRLETAIVPQEEVEKTAEWEVHPIGTGPFKFESFTKDDVTVLVKNEAYWEPDLPLLDRVEHRVIPQNETAVANIRTGDIHASEIQIKDFESLSSAEGVNAQLFTSSFWAHLSLNTAVAPFDNVKVRQAIRLGFNRDDIQEAVFFGTGAVSNTMLPEGNPFRAEVEGWGYDPEAAKALLEEAGFADGFSAKLRVVNNSPWAVTAAQIVQAYLAELNITIEIDQIESTTWFSEVFTNSEFEMSMIAHTSKVDPDLSMLDILHSGELGTKNYTQFDDPEMDALLDQGRIEVDPEMRKQIYADAQKIFVERSGYIVLNIQDLFFAQRSNVQGFTFVPTGELRWKNVSLTA